MKKFTKKLKGKKVLSFVLAAIMLATTFNMALPMLKLDASAATIFDISGITQERVVAGYEDVYESYAEDFLNGAGKATDIVIPGLNIKTTDTTAANTSYDDNDFVVQGLSYYPKQDWMMVTVYHNDGSLPSMVFAIDAKSGEFKHAFEVVNSDGSENKDHGGGLAFSKYNFYYSGDDTDKDNDGKTDASQIAYAPLSYFDKPTDSDGDGFCEVQLKGAVDLPELNGAATAYVCYDEGILWAGNFFENDTGGANYSVPAMPANDTNGIALHNSMIYGYKLQGGSSDEEWAYLTGNEGNTYDRAGRPTHCIAVDTDYEDIQYAVVDNGKLYLSRSWGTGRNDEWFASEIIGDWIASLSDYSTLTVANIDLSVAGTEKIQYTTGGSTVTTYAHKIDKTNTKHFDMMPMSEGLCFVDGDLYISFEGASNKYKNEYSISSLSTVTNTGCCDYPIDVIWKVDPYVLLEEERVGTKEAVSFEKVTKISDIKDDEEYIIIYESPDKDMVTQKNILYAFDAYGNFKDLKLSKSTAEKTNGYDGMIGHKITEYSVDTVVETDSNGNEVERKILYFDNAEKDDLPSLRWNIIDANAGVGELRIQSPLAYYSSNRNFYFNADTISMTNDTKIKYDPLALEEVGDTGKFYLKNSNTETYLWCNDFSVDGYEKAANDWYVANSSTNPMYENLTETKGTFHTDGFGTNNVIGKSVVPNVYLGQFSIYKCITDEYSSTEKNRVYTDMNAELQSDGTYTVNLETYATSALHYKSKGKEKPTDFIFVLDASKSMDEGDGTGLIEYALNDEFTSGDLSVYSVAGEENIDNWNFLAKYRVTNGNGADTTGPIYLKEKNGEFVRLRIRTSAKDGDNQRVWLYYTYQGQEKYWHPVSTTDPKQLGEWKVGAPSAEKTILISGNNTRERGNTTIYYGTHYRYTTSDYHVGDVSGRYITMRETACNIIDEVVADAKATGLGHRFAVAQYGATNGFYDSNTKELSTGTDYSNAFWTAYDSQTQTSQAEDLKTTINEKVSTPADPTTDGVHTYSVGKEFTHANGIITANNGLYTSVEETGRNVAVIFISDGIASTEKATTTTTTSKEGCDEVSEQSTAYDLGGTLADTKNVIEQAKALKEKGAFIYTVLVGHGSPKETYDKEVYMKAVSSEYPEASALGSLGGKCTELVTYNINLAESSSQNFVTYVDKLVKDVKTNDSVGVEKLAGSTVIIEQLSDAFILPDGYDKATFDLYKGYYDCLDRFQFFETAETDAEVRKGIAVGTTKIKTNNDAVMVTGYNYSEKYIAKDHDGYKLKVTLTGLLANPKAENITNTSLNNTDTTAIYQSYDVNNLSANSPFKKFPTEYFSIPEYTYVMDYGQKMLDTQINGKLCSVSDLPTQQSSYQAVSDNKVLEITNENLDLYYTLKPNAYANGVDANDGSTDYSAYSLIKREDGTYDWFKIKLVPASNVLYEESVLTIANKDIAEKIADVPAYQWGKVGKEDTITTQDLATGKDVYGYDSNYANSTDFSNDTYYFAKVDANNKRSDTATFTFTGTSFDLIGACGKYTGMQVVQIGKKVFIVDTFCDDADLLGSDELLYQVPIVNWTGKYDTHTVKVTAAYFSNAQGTKTSFKNNKIDTGLEINSAKFTKQQDAEALLASVGITDVSVEDVELIWFDDDSVLNGGTGVAAQKKGSRTPLIENGAVTLRNYVDGIRIYNPLDEDSSNYIATEQNAVYTNVINNLAPVVEGQDYLDGIAFISGDITNLTWEQYKSDGPKNELYLNSEKKIAFKVNVNPGEKIMLSLRAINGEANFSISSDKSENLVNIGSKYVDEGSQPFTSATEMYYDISKCIGEITEATEVKVTIENTGSTMLAINHIKFSGGSAKNTSITTGARSLNRTSDATTDVTENKFLPITQEDLIEIKNNLAKEAVPGVIKNGVIVPLVEDEEEIPEDNTNIDNDNTNDGADTEGSENEEFSIFSLIEMLIAFIEKILYNAFGAGRVA